MMKRIAFVMVLSAALVPATVSAQDRPATLATLFEDIFGPRGLVVASEDVAVDGTTHAAHFNSAFQSDFRLVNIALTSQLAAIPLPSPASGFCHRPSFHPSNRRMSTSIFSRPSFRC